MKYDKELYLDSGFYSDDMDGEIENKKDCKMQKTACVRGRVR